MCAPETSPVSNPHHSTKNENMILHQDEFGQWSYIDKDYYKDEPAITSFKPEEVQFYVLTPNNPDPLKKQMLTLNDQNIHKYFDIALPTRVVIHGWYTKGDILQPLAEAYFGKGNDTTRKINHNINFIYVDWSKGSNLLNYAQASRNVKKAGEQVARFIEFLIANGMNLNHLAMIAHSIGCHVMGIGKYKHPQYVITPIKSIQIVNLFFFTAGKNFTAKTNRNVPKMTALDPALPLFKFDQVEERLAKTDADYVEVIVTCGGLLGFYRPIGRATFYPNGGRKQSGCGVDTLGICAHDRAFQYYVESINNPHFYAFKCKSFEDLARGSCSVVEKKPVMMAGEPGHTK